VIDSADVATRALKRDEGFRPDVYLDTHGHHTTMYGVNLDASPFTEYEGEMVLQHRIERIRLRLFRQPWFYRLGTVRQAVIINMAYNLGIDGMLKFKKMIAAIEVEDYREAAAQIMDSKAARELTPRYTRLSNEMFTNEVVL